MKLQARTNLSLSTGLVRVGEVVERDVLAPDESDAVVAGVLVAENPDGTFPEQAPPPARCCGG